MRRLLKVYAYSFVFSLAFYLFNDMTRVENVMMTLILMLIVDRFVLVEDKKEGTE